MRRSTWFLLTAGVVSAPLIAQDVAVDKSLALTIYNDDLALVQHVRPLALPAGQHRVEFKGVSAQIMAQTVSFVGPGLTLIEQNFDYDLLTPDKLMEKAVGQTVRIVRTNPGTGEETQETAKVLSTVGGVVLEIGDRIEVLREDGIPARVIFDEVPQNLRATPTLSVLLESERAMSGDVTLTYLTNGLSWNADYVAQFDEQAGTVALQGWITLENTSGTTFANARAQLVAGDINSVADDEQWRRINAAQFGSTTRAAGVESSERQQLADYYVYPIEQTTTIANNQTKQVSFLSVANVAAKRAYEQTFRALASMREPISADVRVVLANSRASGLGDQLPSGVVRVYARDANGQPQFVGEDLIGHTSAGSELAIKIGDAFDVTVLPTLNATTSAPRNSTDHAMSYSVRNARPEPVTVTIRQDSLARFNEVRAESLPGRRTDSDSFAWDVPVPANGEAVLTFTMRVRRL